MSNILHKPIVLKLNRHFLVLRIDTPKNTYIDLAKGTVKALNITYFQNADGSYDFNNVIDITPVTWEDWLQLPIREHDLSVQTARMKVRIPTVIVCAEYHGMPMRRIKLSPKSVYQRDGGICQYTGKKLGKNDWNIDHIQPVSKNGKTIWENVVTCSKEINSMKGNRLNHEVGLKLIRQPKAPLPLPATVSVTAENVAHRDWLHFLLK